MKPSKNTLVIYNEKSIVREANEFIEASYRFNTWEDRIFFMTLAQIKPSDEDFKEYKVYVRDLVLDYGINTHAVYKHMKDAVETLRKKKITVPHRFGTDEGTFTTGLITGYGAVDKEDLSYVVIELHPKLKPYFLKLQQQFTQYNISFLMKMQSGHSRRIYKLLKQYEKIGKRKFTITRLKEILCIEEGEYAKYYDFKRRFILKAQKDLEKYTDLRFTFEEEKKGRRVNAVTFYMRKNTPERLSEQKKLLEGSLFQDMQTVNTGLSTYQKTLFSIVKEWGITEQTFKDILSARKTEHIETCIEVTESSKNIKNKGAYFIGLVKKDEVVNSKKVTEKVAKTQKAKKAKIVQLEEQYQEELKKVKKEIFQEENTITLALLEDSELMEEILELARTSSLSRYDASISFDMNYKKPLFKAFVNRKVKSVRPDSFKLLEAKLEHEEKVLKNKFDSLLKKV